MSIYTFNNLAKWARSNKRNARFILIGLNLAMATLGSCIGLACANFGLLMREEILYAGLILFICGSLFYPGSQRLQTQLPGRLKKRRIYTAVRLTGASISTIAFANMWVGGQSISGNPAFFAAVHPAVLIVLATFGLIILSVTILALSCAMACNGYEAMALVLAVGGVGGFIALYVVLLVRIMKNHRSRSAHKTVRSDELLDEIN